MTMKQCDRMKRDFDPRNYDAVLMLWRERGANWGRTRGGEIRKSFIVVIFSFLALRGEFRFCGYHLDFRHAAWFSFVLTTRHPYIATLGKKFNPISFNVRSSERNYEVSGTSRFQAHHHSIVLEINRIIHLTLRDVIPIRMIILSWTLSKYWRRPQRH